MNLFGWNVPTRLSSHVQGRAKNMCMLLFFFWCLSDLRMFKKRFISIAVVYNRLIVVLQFEKYVVKIY